MIFKDYYKILGLDSSKATNEEIKQAYREQAKKFHPDINGNKFSEERFKDINEAYRVLSDSSSKRKYDRMWTNHIGKKKNFEESKRSEGSLVSDFFMMFFGQGKNKEENEEKSVKKKKVPAKGESGQSRTAIRAAEITAQKLAAVRDGLDVRLVINDFDVSLANLGVRAGLLEMIDECSVRCVGVYPHDDRLPAAQDKGVLLGEGITSVAARNTAARLLGDSVPLFRGLDRLRSKIRL
jgi:hypothetical protein